MKRPNARAHADLAPLTVATIRKVVLSMYHRRHDYGTDADIAELPPVLTAFNITTVKQLRLLMKRHRRALLREERAKMPRAQTLDLLAEGGWRGIDIHANTSWYAIGGLVRVSMEHEFGFETLLPFHEIRADDAA